MLTTERITDHDDAPVYAVRVDGALVAEIRYRWLLWLLETRDHILAADTDLDRLQARLPRLLCRS
jgi:hypothetical protein